MDVNYKGEIVGKYIADIVVEKLLLLELKAVSKLVPENKAQVVNYLKAIGINVALLINFGTPRPEIKRIVWKHNELDLI